MSWWREEVDLAQLIQGLKGDRSFQELCDRAAQFGHHASITSWQNWANPTYKRKDLPSTEAIRSFAAGLGVSETDVLLAAARTVGLNVIDLPSDLVIPGGGDLKPADRKLLTDMAAALMARKGE